jgi:signal transduction histidine kinase
VGFSSWIEDTQSAQGIASTLVLQISDTGAGMDDLSAARAFTRGWSTKTGHRLVGHGLGLALVGQTTHRHHGTVEVGRAENTVSGNPLSGNVSTCTAQFVGAVFTVRLPLAVEGVAP